jgi:hypothetical protein
MYSQEFSHVTIGSFLSNLLARSSLLQSPNLQRLEFLRLALEGDFGDSAAVVEPGVERVDGSAAVSCCPLMVRDYFLVALMQKV